MECIVESDSESDEGESGQFSYLRNREWKAPRKDAPSKLCVSLKIGKGSGTLFCLLKVVNQSISSPFRCDPIVWFLFVHFRIRQV